MSIVTVAGAHGNTVALSFDTAANAALAQKLAGAITAGVQNGSIAAALTLTVRLRRSDRA